MSAAEYEPEQGHFEYRAVCDKCGRFVKESAIRLGNYRPAEGWNGAVDEVHDSHPSCGAGVLVGVRPLWRADR